MALIRLWCRFTLLVIGVIILWTFLRNWNPFFKETDEKVSPNVDDSELRNVEVQRVVIGVYYEALCPDSRGFVLRQLEPMYEKIPDNVVIDMIPYGKAKTIRVRNNFEFSCQHGSRECEANKIHACAIDRIKNPAVQLHFLACMIDHNYWPVNITGTCAKKFHLDAEPILACAKSIEGSILLAKYGEMTQKFEAAANFIPAITIDRNSSNQPAILNNLLGEVCKYFKTLPPNCV